MTAILRNESRGLYRGALVLAAVFALLASLHFSIFPDISEDVESIEEVIEAFPEGMVEFFGIEEYHTIEGYLSAELYSFFWVLLVGMYFAYLGGGLIADDVRTRKLDLTLASPVSRESVLAQKTAALLLPLAVLNTTVPAFVYLGSVYVGETIDPTALAMAHLLSVPYFLACAGIGVVLSVVMDHPDAAKPAALGSVFVLWLVEGVSQLDPAYDWLGYLTPSRYYDETDVLVNQEYAFLDASVLLIAFLLLLAVAVAAFVRKDV